MNSNPLRLHSEIVSGNLDLANEYSSAYLVDQSIVAKGSADQVRFECKRWSVGDIQVCDFSYGDADVEVRVDHLNDRKFFLVVALNGKADIRISRKHYELYPNTALLFEATDRMSFVDTGGFRNLNVGVPYSVLSDYLTRQMGVPFSGEIHFDDNPIRIRGEIASLLDYVGWIWHQLGNAELETFHDNWHLAQHVHDSLLAMLLSATNNSCRETYLNYGRRTAAPRCVREAEEYIRNNLQESLSVGEIAFHVGVAPRTLHLGFRKHRSYTVGQFVRDERLALARRKLSSARGPVNVTEIAFSCGCYHLGKFAARYRKRYGENPSDTLKNRG